MVRSYEQPDYDFVIVGARCAGAATARLLAQAGARVLVLDRGKLGSDTLSTSYLMRGAVMQLQRWGVLPALIAAGTPPVRATHFHYASRSTEVNVRPSGGVDALYAPRRTVLDPLLARAATRAGAELRFGVQVSGLLRDAEQRVCGVTLSHAGGKRERVTAGMVIGADGLRSSVAEWVGAAPYRVGQYSGATIYGYFEKLACDAYHWYYVRGVSAGMAPTNDGQCTVFVGAPAGHLPEIHGDRQAGMLRIAAEISTDLGQALADARRVGALRVFPGMPGYYRKPFGPGWALVGDAGYFRDPDTAHGISDALRDSEVLAEALIEGADDALSRYQRQRDAATERLFHASDELAGGQWDEPRVEELLRQVNQGMRDGIQLIESSGAGAQPTFSSTSVLQTRSNGTPASRFAMRTDSRSGLA